MVAIAIAGCSSDHPTDAMLLEIHAQHRAELERLIEMFLEDKGLGRVGDGFTRPDNPMLAGVRPARIEEYRRLCRVIGARDCIEGYGRDFAARYGEPDPGTPEAKDPIWIHVLGVGRM